MKNLIKKTLVSDAGLEAVILRVPIGLILAAHGSQKLFALVWRLRFGRNRAMDGIGGFKSRVCHGVIGGQR